MEAPADEDLDLRYRTFAPWLARTLASRFGLARRDVEDIVQESFIRLSRYSVADRGRHPKALLMRIAANLSADGFRRNVARRQDRHVPLDVIEHDSASAFGAAADQEAIYEMKRAILDLPANLRETFLLARFTPMTHAEIAAHLGISTKTVEWRIKKCVSICLERFEL